MIEVENRHTSALSPVYRHKETKAHKHHVFPPGVSKVPADVWDAIQNDEGNLILADLLVAAPRGEAAKEEAGRRDRAEARKAKKAAE